jgi:formate dehydrogenase subunit gamma
MQSRHLRLARFDRWLVLSLLAVVALAATWQFATAQSVRPPANATQNTVPGNPAATKNDPGGRGATPTTDNVWWADVRRGAQGNVSIPDKKAGILVQSAGESWRNFRNGPLVVYGAWALGATVALLALFYLLRGQIRISAGWSGRTIERFSDLERTSHWLMAVSFIILGVTGLNVVYGKYVLMPIVGKSAFASISIFFKWLHNYVAFAFMLGLLLSFLLWVRHNFPNRYDLQWIAKGGGLFSKGSHPPARKFNAGQKVLFWLVMLGGLSISISGLSMMFPFQTHMFAQTFGFLNVFGLGLPANPTAIQEMQFATTWHGIMGLFLVCVILGHIYIGTIGMQGAFDAMSDGHVDENWAKEHHSVWAEEELAHQLSTPQQGRPQPAE